MMQNARLDASFAAHPAGRRLDILQKTRTFVPLSDTLTFIGSGHTPYLHDVSEGDVGFITVECVDSLKFDAEKLKRITHEQYQNEFSTKRITAGSVVCTIKRRICKAYPYIEAPQQPLVINQDVALLVPKPEYEAAYIATYLSCSVGQSFADMQKTEQMNPYMSVENLRSLPVAEISQGFQKTLTQFFQNANAVSASANDFYANAEALLLQALGLDNWQPPETLTYEASFASAFDSARLDAEHFQPKYAALLY